MLKDLEAVSELTEDQIAALRHRLEAATGFLDPKKLTGIIRQCISDDRTAGAVQRTLRNLSPGTVERLLQSLEEYSKDKDFPLKKQTLDKLRPTLPKLVVDTPGLRRFEKAERLATLTGRQLEAIDVICDLRPIFDETRTQIEGMMPYTRLHLSITGDDGLPRSFEVELTAQQVHELVEKAGKAEEKLTVLRSKVNDWQSGGLPDLPLTRAPRKESNDGS